MTTIGIISCGELGTAFASMLLARSMDVVTTLEGRSARTGTNCRLGGLRELATSRDVIRVSDVLLSVATPEAAEAVAGRYLELAAERRAASIFVDLNSVGPATISRVAQRFEDRGIPFVDAALVGPASCLMTSSKLYLSGASAEQVAIYIGPDVRTKVLGPRPGDASSLKMLLGGMNKGIAALFIELGMAAAATGSLALFMQEYGESYAGVMALLERMVPTYARHAARRGQEVRQLEDMIRSLDIQPCVVAGAARLIERVSTMDLDAPGTTEALIRTLAAVPKISPEAARVAGTGASPKSRDT